MAENEQPECPLFKLPSEIRNGIYEYVSVAHDSHREPSIFRTCRRIRNEGLKLFYATHVFRFEATTHYGPWEATHYHHFLTRIGADKAAKIEHLQFDVDDEVRSYGMENKEIVSIFVTVHAKEPRILKTCFLRDDVRGDDVASLQATKDAINSAWESHPEPTKVGIMRTLAHLVPSRVRFEGKAEDSDVIPPY